MDYWQFSWCSPKAGWIGSRALGLASARDLSPNARSVVSAQGSDGRAPRTARRTSAGALLLRKVCKGIVSCPPNVPAMLTLCD